MATSSAARQFVTYPTLTTLTIVGVLLFASFAPLYAEPAATQPVNWFAPACAAVSVQRGGFLLPTLPVLETGAVPRLMVTESAFRGAVPMRLTHTAGQTQAPAKPSKSWWSRNWLWVVVPVGIVVGLVALCAKECN